MLPSGRSDQFSVLPSGRSISPEQPHFLSSVRRTLPATSQIKEIKVDVTIGELMIESPMNLAGLKYPGSKRYGWKTLNSWTSH